MPTPPPIVISTSFSPNQAINPGPILLTGTLDFLIDEAKNLHADGIELRLHPHDKPHAQEIYQRVNDAGLIFGGISTGRLAREGGYCFSDRDPEKRHAASKALEDVIDIAALCGTDVLVGSAKGNQAQDEPLQAYCDRLADGLAGPSRYAEERGVKIHIEAINRYEINALTRGSATLAFIEEYELNNCYVHLDTFHMNIEEADLYSAILQAGERLGYFQFADSNRLPPGLGHIDFHPLVTALTRIGYAGPWSLEYQPLPCGREAAARGIEYIRTTFFPPHVG